MRWLLVYRAEYQDYSQARKREMELKRQKGGEKFYQMTGLQPEDFPRGQMHSGS